MFLHDRVDPNDRFRERREQARRRRGRRRATAFLLIAAAIAAIAGGATYFSSGGHGSAQGATGSAAPTRVQASSLFAARVPAEIRGVHVTEGLASLPGKLESYFALARQGLNTVELDVKDENGYVGFVDSDTPALAKRVGAARPYYDAKKIVREAHRAGIYLIGRVVVFQDPTLTSGAPDLGIQSRNGGVWKTSSGWGWANEYDPRVWKYDTDVAVAAAKAGFD